jgi:tRNA-dihydrouridine synthase 3
MFRLARAVSVATPRRLSRGGFSRSLAPARAEGDAPAVPKRPHVDGRRQFSDIPDGMETVERVVTDEKIAAFRASIANELMLAPLTKGGNLPFRRLCVDLGCNVTVSEMVFARYALKRNPVELARLRRHESEKTFGVQIATNQIAEGVNAGRLAFESGADFLDLNCGCPIHETWKRGLGAKLLKKPAKLERLVRGIADGVPLPLTVKIRLGAGASEAPAAALAEACENAGAAAVIIHGRTKEQRYTRAANWNLIGEIRAERAIPVVGNGDILTWYEHKNRVEQSGAFATMTGRGALIKPWIFKEKIDGAEWDPTPEARVGVYLTLCGYFKEHFRADELGKKRYMEFMPWHFGFFCRYRPLPETVYGAMAREHPLLQTRLGVVESAAIAAAEARHLSPLDRLLRVELEECHARLSEALWDADQDVGRAVELFEAMTTDGSLERWEAEERAERARSRDPDASLGAGDTIRG